MPSAVGDGAAAFARLRFPVEGVVAAAQVQRDSGARGFVKGGIAAAQRVEELGVDRFVRVLPEPVVFAQGGVIRFDADVPFFAFGDRVAAVLGVEGQGGGAAAAERDFRVEAVGPFVFALEDRGAPRRAGAGDAQAADFEGELFEAVGVVADERGIPARSVRC